VLKTMIRKSLAASRARTLTNQGKHKGIVSVSATNQEAWRKIAELPSGSPATVDRGRDDHC
ncbi:MAG TPA: hypothetical protein VIX19_02240, partial [Terriglobales bacterium]